MLQKLDKMRECPWCGRCMCCQCECDESVAHVTVLQIKSLLPFLQETVSDYGVTIKDVVYDWDTRELSVRFVEATEDDPVPGMLPF